MSKDQTAHSREERLAAKLRENLRRRKEQARAQACSDPHGDEPLTLSKGEASG